MCTVSWCFGEERLELFFNRDELRSRARAEEPDVRVQDGARFLAPIDGDAGGTWISANEWGVVLALLNAPSAALPVPQRLRSRGVLVHELARERSVSRALHALQELDLRDFRGFRIALLEIGRQPVLGAWDGRSLEVASAAPPLASSSFLGSSRSAGSGPLPGGAAKSAGGVEDGRRQQFDAELRARVAGADDAAFLESFHRTHVPSCGPLSVCMHREDAHTVSATHVSVTPASVRMRYADGSPCEVPFAPAVLLPRSVPSQGIRS